MTTATTPLMSVDDFTSWCNRPENTDRLFELDRGRIVEVPSPRRIHGLINWSIITILTDDIRPRGGHVFTHDTGIILHRNPDTLRGPDIMLYLRPPTSDDMTATYVEDIPNLIVEVLSPDDRRSRTDRRIEQDLTRGVPLVWVVDPEDRVVTVHRPSEIQKVLDEADELTGNGVLPEFHCRVADLFTLPGQATTG